MTRNEFEKKALSLIDSSFPNPHVMQLGSRVIYGAKDSVKRLFPSVEFFSGVDYIAGDGVDLVVDCHRLTDKVLPESFDVVWSDATLEHLINPHVAVSEMARVLKIGGFCVHITHQTFPLHAFPYDYWRFSTDAMKSLFCKEFGFEMIDSQYCWPVRMISCIGHPAPPATEPCFIHTMVIARKICEPVKEITSLRDVLFPK
jgi:SAM-dependent methyltransferase